MSSTLSFLLRFLSRDLDDTDDELLSLSLSLLLLSLLEGLYLLRLGRFLRGRRRSLERLLVLLRLLRRQLSSDDKDEELLSDDEELSESEDGECGLVSALICGGLGMRDHKSCPFIC